MAESRNWLDGGLDIPVKNNSGETIPPYACMELDYEFESLKSATEVSPNEVDVSFSVIKPTLNGEGSPSRIVFNRGQEIPIDGYGTASVAPLRLAMIDTADGTPLPGSQVGAKDGQWFLSAIGLGFTLKSYDSGEAYYISASQRSVYIETAPRGLTYGTIDYDVFPNAEGTFTDSITGQTSNYVNICTQQTFLGERVLFHELLGRWAFLDRCERIFQYHLATPWLGGIAIAYRLSMDGVSSGKLVLVRDPLGGFSEQTAGAKGYMQYTVEDKFYAIQAPCNLTGTPPSVPSDPGRGCCSVATSFTPGNQFYVPNLTSAECDAQNLGYGSTYLGDGVSCPSE